MNTQSKTALLQALEARVESHLQVAVTTFQNFSAAQLLRPAPDGGWSIAQCLAHLNSYGRYYLPRIRESITLAPEADASTFKSSWLGAYFTRIMEPGRQMKKMKAPKAHNPLPQPDAVAVVAEFIAQQEALLRLLRQAASRDIGRIRIAISLSRWVKLKLGDTFGFLVAHDERHVQQALRLL